MPSAINTAQLPEAPVLLQSDQLVRSLGSRRRRGPRCSVVVIGVGNVLQVDEGIGVRTVEAMSRMDLPDDVELVDGGTIGLDLLDEIADRRHVVLIDAVKSDQPPGTVQRFAPDQLMPDQTDSMSLHEAGLMSALTAAEVLGIGPDEVVIFGVTPKTVAWGTGLTDELVAAIPKIIETVLAEIESNQAERT